MKKSLENRIFNLKDRCYIEYRNGQAFVSNSHWLVTVPLRDLSPERAALVKAIPEGKCSRYDEVYNEATVIDAIFDQIIPKKRGKEVHVTRLALECGKHFNRKLASDDKMVVTYLNQDYLDLIQELLSQTNRPVATIETEESPNTVVTFRDIEGTILALCMPVREDGEE